MVSDGRLVAGEVGHTATGATAKRTHSDIARTDAGRASDSTASTLFDIGARRGQGEATENRTTTRTTRHLDE